MNIKKWLRQCSQDPYGTVLEFDLDTFPLISTHSPSRPVDHLHVAAHPPRWHPATPPNCFLPLSPSIPSPSPRSAARVPPPPPSPWDPPNPPPPSPLAAFPPLGAPRIRGDAGGGNPSRSSVPFSAPTAAIDGRGGRGLLSAAAAAEGLSAALRDGSGGGRGGS